MSELRTRLIRRAHALANELDMDHDTLSDFACVTFEVDSMKDLTIDDLQKLVRRLAQEVVESLKLSDNQKNRIYGLGYKELKWTTTQIRKFIKRQVGRFCSVQSLTPSEANKVINGMEAVAIQEPVH